MSKIPYVIYLIGALVLITPAFLANNSSTKVFFKNVTIWGAILLIIIFIYRAFVIDGGVKINFSNIKGLLLDLEGVVYEEDPLVNSLFAKFDGLQYHLKTRLN